MESMVMDGRSSDDPRCPTQAGTLELFDDLTMPTSAHPGTGLRLTPVDTVSDTDLPTIHAGRGRPSAYRAGDRS